jgi:alpha-1,6-mannosyltransferase
MTTATNQAKDSLAVVSGDPRWFDSHWSVARPWQTNAALIFIGIALFFFSRQLTSEYTHFTIGFSGVSGWSCIL